MLVSLSDAWDDTQAFLRREYALLLPVAIATIGLALLIFTQVAPPTFEEMQRPAPWMWWLVPIGAVFIYGCIAISALVLLPQLSVGEALRTAARRMPVALLLVIAATLASGVLTTVVSLVFGIIGVAGGLAPAKIQSLAGAPIMAITLWALVRLLPIWALIAQHGNREGVFALVRRCLALTRRVFWRLLAAVLVFMFVSAILDSAIQVALGSVVLLVGRLLDEVAAATLLLDVIMSGVSAAIQLVWIVYVAFVYRRLSDAKGM